MATDDELLRAWRRGDRASGEELFARYFDPIYAFFAAKVAPSDVADLVQGVFVGCVEGADRFRAEGSVRAYFYGIARYVLYHHYRTRRRQPTMDFGVSSLMEVAPTPSSLLVRGEEQRHLREALASLPLEQQLLLELRYDVGLTGPELAVALELKEGTVRSRLRRALAALREHLSDADPSSEAQLALWSERAS